MPNGPDSAPSLTLVLGGASSGKSRYAEGLVTAASDQPVYIATALSGGKELAAKIDAHRSRRGAGWQTREMSPDGAIDLKNMPKTTAILFDCATLWLSAAIERGEDWQTALPDLLDRLRATGRPVVIVSNELGQGLVPEHPDARRFRDAHGLMNQFIAEQADRVVLISAGLPLTLKGSQ